MKTVTTTLYRYSELSPNYQQVAEVEYYASFLKRVMTIEEVWFTSSGLVYAVFNA